MDAARQISQSGLSLPADSYIYSIQPLTALSSLVASCSDSSLRVFSPADLILQTVLPTGHAALSAFVASSTYAFTGGSDGILRSWDLRTPATAQQTSIALNGKAPFDPITSLALSETDVGQSTKIAVGTELSNHKATVLVYDLRQLSSGSASQPLVCFDESHNDDITELVWSREVGDGERYLLSGSTDGLINVYDVSQSDPDDALVKILNAGSSVSHAGFLPSVTPSGPLNGYREHLYSISHDEQLTTWAVPVHANAPNGPRYVDSEDEEIDDAAHLYGDLRPLLDCEYVIGVSSYGSQKIMGVGSHSKQTVDLIPLQYNNEFAPGGGAHAVRLPGAHGEEIVRTTFLDESSDVIFTGGEDGQVKVWRTQSGENDMDVKMDQGPVRGKSKKGNKSHLFKPY